MNAVKYLTIFYAYKVVKMTTIVDNNTAAAPLNHYQKYIKPRLETDPAYREQYIKHHVEMMVNRYRNDPEFRHKHNERNKQALRNRYSEDPEYRAKKSAYAKLYYERKKATKLASQSS